MPKTIFTCRNCGRTQAPVEACLKVCECGGSIFSTSAEGQTSLPLAGLATAPHRRNRAPEFRSAVIKTPDKKEVRGRR